MTMLLSALLDGVSGVRDAAPQLSVSAMTLDSRAVSEGAVFVALSGTREHGQIVVWWCCSNRIVTRVLVICLKILQRYCLNRMYCC